MNFLKMESWNQIALWGLSFCLIFQTCYGFNFSKSDPTYYSDELWVKVNHVNPHISFHIEIPFSYYTLPFCEPQGGVKYNAKNLGSFFNGDIVANSPYRFKMSTNESDIFLCQVESLSRNKFNLLKKSIDEMYQVTLILDNLPAIVFAQKKGNFVRRTGYRVGFKVQDVYYIFNHLKFNVLIHKYDEVEGSSKKPGYMVVGFEVIPCSVKHNVDSVSGLKIYNHYPSPVKCDSATVGMPIKEGQPIVFTYEVTFEESDIKWSSRWDAYLKVDGAKFHWFATLKGLMLNTFVVGIVLLIFLWMVRRDLAQCGELDKEAQPGMKEKSFGWRLVHADVFRTPSNPSLLCLMIGSGIQILGMTILSLIFAALGFMSLVSRRTLIMGMLFFYMILSVATGYVTIRLWRTMSKEGWISIPVKTTCYFTFLFLTLAFSYSFLWRIPNSVSFILILISVLFCISMPLTLVGGYFGAKAPFIQIPVQTDADPCNIPYQRNIRWELLYLFSMLSFIIIPLELIIVMPILKMSPMYVIGFFFLVLIQLVVLCVEVSLFQTYIHFCLNDWSWWWKSFYASGLCSFLFLILSLTYLHFDLKSLSNRALATDLVILWLAFSLYMAVAIMLATGTIGFLSSFWFVYYLYDAYMLEQMKSQDGFISEI